MHWPSPMRRLAAMVACNLVAACCLAAAPARAADFVNPVIPGDHADPSVVRDGSDFYAVTTSGQWAPAFALFHSTDLVSWQQVGSVLGTAPAWSNGNYWAPEIISDGGSTRVYYAASRRGGKPCIGLAVAPSPAGPYTDRGTIMCPPRGAIDPAFVRDEEGRAWLVWKAMGSGQGLWLSPMDARGQQVSGGATPLIGPERSWEGGVTEGPYLVRRAGWWYLFFSGGTCCRQPCSYAVGVARSKAIQGPYLRDPDNPILHGDRDVRCPGHGSLVATGQDEWWFLHHGYRAGDTLRRQVFLDPVTWRDDGWPLLGEDGTVMTSAPAPLGGAQAVAARPGASLAEGFGGTALGPGWEWPFDRQPPFAVAGGDLRLGCAGRTARPSLLSRRLDGGGGTVTTTLRAGSAGTAGLGLLASDGSMDGIEAGPEAVRTWSQRGGRVTVPSRTARPATPMLRLRATLAAGMLTGLAYSADGRVWSGLPTTAAQRLAPPRVRVLLTCHGAPKAAAAFTSLRVSG
jgi:xylan 1,4-beta-xylosidase